MRVWKLESWNADEAQSSLLWFCGSQLSPSRVLLGDSLVQTSFTSRPCRFVPAYLIGSLRFQSWHRNRPPIWFAGDEGKEAEFGLGRDAGGKFLGFHPDSNFQGGPPNVVHAR